MIKKIIIAGCSGHGKVILDILECIIKEQVEEIEITGFLDDNYSSKSFMGYDYLGKISEIDNYKETHEFIIAIGNNKIREKIICKYSKVRYYSAIHPHTIIANNATIGAGTVVMAGTVINSCASIGEQCIINTSSIIEHDNVLGNYVHISPNAALAGTVKVGQGTHIGIGSAIINNLNIGKYAIIGAGSVVIKDIPDNCTVVGVPAKIIKEGINNGSI